MDEMSEALKVIVKSKDRGLSILFNIWLDYEVMPLIRNERRDFETSCGGEYDQTEDWVGMARRMKEKEEIRNMTEKHELIEELDMIMNFWDVDFEHNIKEFEECKKQISLELFICDRFHEINPELWEQFKKEILEEGKVTKQ